MGGSQRKAGVKIARVRRALSFAGIQRRHMIYVSSLVRNTTGLDWPRFDAGNFLNRFTKLQQPPLLGQFVEEHDEQALHITFLSRKEINKRRQREQQQSQSVQPTEEKSDHQQVEPQQG